jgi:AraC-like DNA-binding protein
VRNTTLVAHTCPLIAAGIASTLRQQTDFDVIDCREIRQHPLWVAHSARVQLVIGDPDVWIRSFEDAMPRTLYDAASPPKVLAVMTHAAEREHPTAFGVRADGSVSVQCEVDELLAAVRRLLAAPDTPQPSVADQNQPPLEVPFSDARRRAASMRASRRPRGGLAPAALRRVREHISTHLHQTLGLSQLADIAELSVHHFSRAFRQSLGMPPHRYILSHRISKATQLMNDSDLPLSEIALVVGFSDQSHFTRVFSRATGETPALFRRRRR